MKLTVKSILFLLVLLLLGTSIAVIVTYRNHLNNEQAIISNNNGETIVVPDQQIGRFFRDTLNLNPEQQQQFRTYRREYHRNANDILIDLQQIRAEMTNLLSQSQLNNTELDNLANQLGERHAQLKKETFNYYYNLRNELDDEQQVTLEQIFRSMLYDENRQPHTRSQNKRGNRRGRMFRD
ncbi:MAG: periplasmic heavy metal sensor [Prolixibacteraceae bacterium]|jgi:Spy/CpxP family protein refolding chaperone|nr:periplasmic heavy metal sensor [Prolixibacteraceae bacterium]